MKKSLFKRFMLAFLIPVVLIMAYNLFVITQLVQDSRENTNNYSISIISSLSQSIEHTFMNLNNAAQTFSYSAAIQKMATGIDPISPANVAAMLQMAHEYNPDLLSVLLTDSTGETFSLQGYLSQSVESVAKEIAQKNFAGEISPSVVFEKDGNSFLLHCAPVFATKVSQQYGEKVGIVSIVCKTNSLRKMLNSADNMYIELIDTQSGETLIKNNALVGAYEGNTLILNNSESVTTQNLHETQLALRGAPIEFGLDAKLGSYVIYMIASVFIALFACLFLAAVVNRLFLRPIAKMNNDIVALETEDTSLRLQNIPNDEIGSISLHINSLLDTIHTLNSNVAESRENLYYVEIMKRKAQLYAYQSQINPHFLYNMLQCMRGIALYSGVEQIADICNSMAVIFRYSIKGENLVPLEKELLITEKYLKMMSVRYQNKIQYSILADPKYYRCKISKLTLQPLIENAVEHGFAPVGYEGDISISLSEKNGLLYLEISNNGEKIAAGKLQELQKQLQEPVRNSMAEDETAHIGIINVHDKIRLTFGMQYGICIRSKEGETVVTVRLPIENSGS